jgi:hypothetical protein
MARSCSSRVKSWTWPTGPPWACSFESLEKLGRLQSLFARLSRAVGPHKQFPAKFAFSRFAISIPTRNVYWRARTRAAVAVNALYARPIQMLMLLGAVRKGVMRTLLSFNSADTHLVSAFRAGLFMLAPEMKIHFSPALFDESITLDVNDSDAIILFVGKHGLGDVQLRDFRVAMERIGPEDQFIAIAVLSAGAQMPLDCPRSVNSIEAPIVTDREMLRQVVSVLKKDSRLINARAGVDGVTSGIEALAQKGRR